jgi:hypothetical protein
MDRDRVLYLLAQAPLTKAEIERKDAIIAALVEEEEAAGFAWLTTEPTTMAGILASLEYASLRGRWGVPPPDLAPARCGSRPRPFPRNPKPGAALPKWNLLAQCRMGRRSGAACRNHPECSAFLRDGAD